MDPHPKSPTTILSSLQTTNLVSNAQNYNRLTMTYLNTEDPASNPWTKFTSEQGLDAPQLVHLALALLLAGVSIRAITNKESKFPYVNPPKAIDLLSKACKKHFAENASTILAHARSLYPMEPFKMMTDSGEVIVLPAQFANEIRNEAGLNFMQTVDEDFHASVPGFEPFAAGSNGDNLIQVITRKQLTKSLSKALMLPADPSFPVR